MTFISLLSLTICLGFSAEYTRGSVFCPTGYGLYKGRCFRTHRVALKFFDAEAACNKLPGGHLAAFRSHEELDFINDLIGGYVWVGLIKEGGGGHWMFTDGSTFPPNVTFHVLNGGNCAFLTNDGLDDHSCGSTRHAYCCMTKVYGGQTVRNEHATQEHHLLFDLNVTTCLNVELNLSGRSHYQLDLSIPRKIEHGVIGVYFNQSITCENRQVMYVLKNSTTCNDQYIKSCDLLTTGSDLSTSCKYRCPCKQDGCLLAVLDEKDKYHDQPADVCEITYTEN